MSVTEHALRDLAAGDLVEDFEELGALESANVGKPMSVYSLEDHTQIKHVMAKPS